MLLVIRKNINHYYYEEYIIIELFIHITFLYGNFSIKHFMWKFLCTQIETEIEADISLLITLILN